MLKCLGGETACKDPDDHNKDTRLFSDLGRGKPSFFVNDEDFRDLNFHSGLIVSKLAFL